MWNKFKSLNTLNKIFFGIIAFVIFPITITAFLGELSIKLLSNGFKNKKKLKIISGFIAAYFFIACATSTFLIYKDSFKNSSETAKMSTGESEVQADKNIDSKDKKDVKLSEDEQKISKVTNLAPEQVQNTAKILKECGIEEFESIKHDEGLDNAHFDGEKGYRIEFGGSKNIILYMNKDNSVYNVRWADNDFYKDGKVVSKVSDYTLTMDEKTAFPDTLVGTDSHTTMINGIGVLGWGVGGIEAEAGMLGQPSYFPIPEVIGVRLTHSLPQGSTATDLALRVTEELRKKGVVGKFVEFFGPGVQHLPLADRATIANMAPEYGATCGFFPVDEESLKYMKLTGRDEEHIELVKEYLQQNHMFFDVEKEDPEYTDVIDLDLSTVEASLSGPKRPQDLIFLSDMKKEFEKSVTAPAGNQGHGLDQSEFDKKAEINFNDGSKATMKTGDIAIAAITSCTNTSNPYVMLGAGLVAKKAVEKGLKVPEFVKTSLAPGSKVVTGYLRDSGLQQYLDDLGFNLVGYGCTTCIGNSGPLLIEIEKAVADEDLLVTSVLSGNRNFEGRIHPLVKANYLASPQLVVAYALAGTVDIDLQNEPIGKGKDGKDVYLQDIWPSIQEVSDTVDKVVTPELFLEEYKNVYHNNEMWNEIDVTDEPLYDFDPNSTYIQNPTFFQGLSKEPGKIEPLKSLRVMGKFGDSVTTDHISPAGAIGKDTPAGKYLLDHDVAIRNFNSYGSRRGNHEVMVRGTFANIRIKNQLAPGTEGGFTTYWPTGEIMPIYDAAMKYKEDGTGLVVLAGNDYGMGSSRDWAAKGTNLLGVKTVIAQSYERIHRSNLVMMGVLPLQFQQGESAEALGLDGKEEISVDINEDVQPHDLVNVTAKKENGEIINFKAIVRFDSLVELDYYRHGGILQMVLRNKLAQ